MLPLVNYSHCVAYETEINDKNYKLGILFDIILRNIDCYVVSTLFILLLPIRKDFSIINETKAFMSILFVFSLSRNLVEIFVNDGEEK